MIASQDGVGGKEMGELGQCQRSTNAYYERTTQRALFRHKL